MAKWLFILSCGLSVAGCNNCVRSHAEIIHVPRTCQMETLGNPGMPYPIGTGIGGLLVPIEVCHEAYAYTGTVCDEWSK